MIAATSADYSQQSHDYQSWLQSIWVIQDKHTRFGGRIEREAEDFTAALLMDVREALAAHLTESWEVAEHFGVPDQMVRLQLPLLVE